MGDGLSFLSKQLGLCESQAQVLETWETAHEEAMACTQLEDSIELMLSMLRSLRRHNEHWAVHLQEAPEDFSWDNVRKFAELYRKWHELSQRTLDVVDLFKAEGFVVQGADQLRDESHQVALMSLDTDRVRRSIESLEEDRGIPFAQAMDELRHHLR
jgi:hypothetical protein